MLERRSEGNGKQCRNHYLTRMEGLDEISVLVSWLTVCSKQKQRILIEGDRIKLPLAVYVVLP